MKTIKHLSLILIGLLVLISCEEDMPLNYALKFKAQVEQEQKATYINDSKEISYAITTEYKFDKVQMKIKLNTDKKGVFMLGEKTLEVGKFYNLNQQKNAIKYIGLAEGKHHLTFHFENEHKEKSIKELDVDFVRKEFNVEVKGKFEDIIQGEENEYLLRILSSETDKDKYQIRFDSYDKLGDFKIKFYKTAVELGKWYDMDINVYVPLILQTSNSGAVTLKYSVRNSSNIKDFEFTQTIKGSSIILKDFSIDKTETNSVNDNINISGVVLKSPKLTKTIYYKTWLSDATSKQPEGLSTTNGSYTKYELSDTNEFKIKLNTHKIGSYTLKLQFKDEYGNESEVKEFKITVLDKDFNLKEQGDFSSVHQGQNSSFKVGVYETNPTNESYQIRFTEFNGKINFNGQAVVLGNWYKIDKNKMLTTVINSSVVGAAKLKYEIKNSYKTKSKEIRIDVKGNEFTIVQKGSFDNIYQGQSFNVQVGIEETPKTNEIYYIRFIKFDGVVKKGTKVYELGNWYQLDKNSLTNFNLQASTSGTKTLRYEVKNSYKTKSKDTTIKVKSIGFTIVQKGSFDNVYQGKPFNVQVGIDETPKTNETYYIRFIKFDGVVKKGTKVYELGNWYQLDKNSLTNFNLQASTSGNTALKYEVKNSYKTELKETLINIKRTQVDVKEKEFTIIQKGSFDNIYQGKPFNVQVGIEETSKTSETYQIRFIKFDGVVKKGAKVYELGNWYPLDKNSLTNFNLQASTSGSKILRYEVKNSYKTELKETLINIKRTQVDVKEKEFTIIQKGSFNNIYQGQAFSVQVGVEETPKTNETYYIRFIKFDGVVKKGAKVYELGNWYQLDKNSFTNFNLQALTSGSKILRYEVKNSYKTRSKDTTIEVKSIGFTIVQKGSFDNIYQGKPFNVQVGIDETPKTSETYQIRIVKFDGVVKNGTKVYELGNWYQLDNNGLTNLTLLSKHQGNTIFEYEIKNSFITKKETNNILVKALNFTINQTGNTQLLQGEDAKLNVSVSEESVSEQTYQIRFTQYDGTIKLNGQNVALNKWVAISKKGASIVLHSDNTENKVLVYQIKNDFVTNTKTSHITVNKVPFEITRVEKPNEDSYYLNKEFSVRMYLKTSGKAIKYKISSNNPKDINNINSTFKSMNVTNNYVEFKFKPQAVGNYKLDFTLKDEYGNELTKTIEFKTQTKVSSKLYVTYEAPKKEWIETDEVDPFGDFEWEEVDVYSYKIDFGFNLDYTVPNNKTIKKVIVKVNSYWQDGVQILPSYTKTYNINAKSVNKKFEIVNQDETATFSDYENDLYFKPTQMSEPWRNFVKSVDYLSFIYTNPYIEVIVIHSDGYEDTIRSFINN